MVPAYVAARELERRRAKRLVDEAARQLTLHLDDIPPVRPDDAAVPLPDWTVDY
jgi:hypothetical protein